MCRGPFDDDFFSDIDSSHWSLLVSDIEKLLPDFQTWLQPFRFLPDWRIDDLMISYAPPGGSVGAHIDQYDVFLLQADGAREWQIETRPRAASDHLANADIALLSDFDAQQSYTLRRGDMLYLPPGHAHHGIATEEPCMTWSIGFRAPTMAELMPSLLQQVCSGERAEHRFSDPARAVTSTPGLIPASDLAQLRQLFRQAMQTDDATLNRWLAQALSDSSEPESDAAIEPDNADTDALASFAPHSARRFLYTVDDETHTLFVEGQCYECSASLCHALCNDRWLPPALIATLSPGDREIINHLQRTQMLQTCDDRHH